MNLTGILGIMQQVDTGMKLAGIIIPNAIGIKDQIQKAFANTEFTVVELDQQIEAVANQALLDSAKWRAEHPGT